MAARRSSPLGPPPEGPPKLLPDGSESLYHEGSFHSYMYHKNRKLQEQFHERAALLPGQQRTQLFAGVSIHVNGYTQPSHSELKQLMALHGGDFQIYYTRSTVTHIICGNLPDAKVKHFERERSPTPVVRPQWVVDSITAGHLLPIQDYVLWQLRDAPGQQKLKGFQQVRPAALPPTAIYGSHAGAVGAAVDQAAAEAAAAPGEASPVEGSVGAPAVVASTDAAAAEEQQGVQPEPFSFAVPPLPRQQSPDQEQRGGWQQQGAQPQDQAHGTRHQHGFDLPRQGDGQQHHQQQSTSKTALPQQRQHEQQEQRPESAAPAPPVLAGRPHAPAASGGAGGRLPAHQGASSAAHEAAAPDRSPARQAAGVAAAAGAAAGPSPARLPGRGGVAAARGTSALAAAPAPHLAAVERVQPQEQQQAGYSAAEMQRAQQIARRMRAECDMLKGAPKSSKEDPNFVDSFYKASRLHFIGTWKARIEALMASSVASEGPTPAPHAPGRPRSTIHLDMDCFFAAVTEASNPAFRGKPLAVCHSASARGTGEVSTCNYQSRKYGVASGMMISRAKDLCPDLIVVPYQFERYEEVSDQVYGILLKHTSCVQPLSCDEAYLDVTGLGNPEQIAAAIRAEIQAATGCTASAGLGPNLLLSRIATDRAKPNGQFMVRQEQARQFLAALAIDQLPGVGYRTQEKLESRGIHTVADVLARSKEFLQAEMGAKLGAMLWDFAHGRDNRQVEPPRARKSVGAEVNWGVRFTSDDDAHRFIDKLAVDLQSRMQQAGVKGRTLTLKIKRRKEGAAEPIKFLGHGHCDSLSRSVSLARFTASAEEIGRECWSLLRALRVPFADIRGVGIAATRLDNDATSASARPGGAPPSKLAAPPASRFDPNASNPWAAYWKKKQQGPEGQQQQQQGLEGQQQGNQQQQHQGVGGQQQDNQQQQHQGLEGRQQQQQGLEGQQDGQPQPQQQDPSSAPPAAVAAAAEEVAAGAGNQQALGGSKSPAATGSKSPGGGSKSPATDGRNSPGGGRNSPAGAKQASLEMLLQRQAAAAAEQGRDWAAAQGRRQLLEQWQGVSLAQMDASVFAALPWSVQKELVERMPRGSRQQSQQQQQHLQEQQHADQQPLETRQQQQKQPASVQRFDAAERPAEVAPGAAAGGAGPPLSPPAPAAALPAAAAGGASEPKEEERQQQQQQLEKQQGKQWQGSDQEGEQQQQQQASSDGDEDWVPASQPVAAAVASGAAAGDAAAGGASGPSMQPAQQGMLPGANQQLRQEGTRSAAGGPAGSGSLLGSGGSGSSRIVALPALSQIDPSVLDALPLQLKRELERAYGIHRDSKRPLAAAFTAQPARRGGRGSGSGHHHAAAAAGGAASRHVSKRQRLDSFLSNPPPLGFTGSGRAVAAAAAQRQQEQQQQQRQQEQQQQQCQQEQLQQQCQQEQLQQQCQQEQQQQQQQLSMSQVDPAVLQELPPEVQQEVLQQLRLQQQQRQGAADASAAAAAAAGSAAAAAATGPSRLRGQQQQQQQQQPNRRSRLGQQQDDQEQAWRRRWEEEQQQQQEEEEAAAGPAAAEELAFEVDDMEAERQQQSQQDLGQLSPAVQQFVAAATAPAAAKSASSLAAALAGCLQQLQELLAASADACAEASPQQPSCQQARGGSGASSPVSGSSSGKAASNPGSGGGGSSSSMDVDLPPTQQLAVVQQQQQEQAGEEAAAEAPSPAAAAAAEVVVSSVDPPLYPQRQSLQRGAGDVHEQAAEEAQELGGRNGSGGRQHSQEMQLGLLAVCSSIQQAAAALLAARDLEQLRLLLLAVQRLGGRHPWFAAGGGTAAVEAVQQRVQGQYGWRLRLSGLLEGAAGGDGST